MKAHLQKRLMVDIPPSVVTIVRIFLTRAGQGQPGSRGCQVEGGGPLHPLDTGHHLGKIELVKFSASLLQ